LLSWPISTAPAPRHGFVQSARPIGPRHCGHRVLREPTPRRGLRQIAENFTEWADPRSAITLDQILADVSIYWFTATAGSSACLANESPRGKAPGPVPVGVVVLPYDILQSVRPLAEQDYDIVHWTEFDRGGHFSGLEVPGLLAADIRDFFHKLKVPYNASEKGGLGLG
jgi:epoxide hydrolase